VASSAASLNGVHEKQFAYDHGRVISCELLHFVIWDREILLSRFLWRMEGFEPVISEGIQFARSSPCQIVALMPTKALL
jgi:hypothetical protein